MFTVKQEDILPALSYEYEIKSLHDIPGIIRYGRPKRSKETDYDTWHNAHWLIGTNIFISKYENCFRMMSIIENETTNIEIHKHFYTGRYSYSASICPGKILKDIPDDTKILLQSIIVKILNDFEVI